jgi:hypothetical protein
MNGKYLYTQAGRRMNKEWGRSVYDHERSMNRLYGTKGGRSATKSEKFIQERLDALEQKRLLEKYAHIPHTSQNDI